MCTGIGQPHFEFNCISPEMDIGRPPGCMEMTLRLGYSEITAPVPAYVCHITANINTSDIRDRTSRRILGNCLARWTSISLKIELQKRLGTTFRFFIHPASDNDARFERRRIVPIYNLNLMRLTPGIASSFKKNLHPNDFSFSIRITPRNRIFFSFPGDISIIHSHNR